MKHTPSLLPKIVAAFVMFVPAWLSAIDPKDGGLYKDALVTSIKTADRIVVTEHSDRADFPPNERNRKDLPKFEYGRVELSEPAKAKFPKNCEAMDATTEDIFTVCIFVPHHTLAFYSGSTLKSTMDICFHCGQIVWDGSKRTNPKGLWSAIIPLIKDAGFHGDRDWAALVQQRGK